MALLVAACLTSAPPILPLHAEDQTAPPVARPASPVLDKLFADLKAAPDAASAQGIEQAIWQAWLSSGDATIDQLVAQAVTATNSGSFADAIALLDVVVQKAPLYAEGWNKRATVLYLVGEHDKSLADIAEVLRLEPRHFGAISGLGLIKLAGGDKRAALDAYRKVIEISPRNAGALQSIEILEKELEGDPT